jgi:hypothetical protein
MISGKEVSFDQYLDMIFAGPIWLDACTGMLSVFLEDIEGCRENPRETLPEIAPSIVDQVSRVAERARRLEGRFRQAAEERGPRFQTTELGAVLWWVGLACHKAAGNAENARERMDRKAWDDAFIDVHSLLYETMSALSLLAVAEGMLAEMEEANGETGGRPN